MGRGQAHQVSRFDLLLACYRSGQISERQWQEHLKDEALRKWLEKQGFGHLT